jgi:NADPH:quinone reductase-like Zn-dependent oxidoreductase
MRQLQLMAFGEPSDVIQLNTLAELAGDPEDVLVSMEAAPLNPSWPSRNTRTPSTSTSAIPAGMTARMVMIS